MPHMHPCPLEPVQHERFLGHLKPHRKAVAVVVHRVAVVVHRVAVAVELQMEEGEHSPGKRRIRTKGEDGAGWSI